MDVHSKHAFLLSLLKCI